MIGEESREGTGLDALLKACDELSAIAERDSLVGALDHDFMEREIRIRWDRNRRRYGFSLFGSATERDKGSDSSTPRLRLDIYWAWGMWKASVRTSYIATKESGSFIGSDNDFISVSVAAPRVWDRYKRMRDNHYRTFLHHLGIEPPKTIIYGIYKLWEGARVAAVFGEIGLHDIWICSPQGAWAVRHYPRKLSQAAYYVAQELGMPEKSELFYLAWTRNGEHAEMLSCELAMRCLSK